MNNKEKLKVAKRMIAIMLCILFACYTAFIFGAEWFTVTLPQQLSGVDAFILKNKWLWFLIISVFLSVQLLLFCCCVFQKRKLKWWVALTIIAVVFGVAATRVFIPLETIQKIKINSLTTDLALFVIMPILLGKFVFKIPFERLFIFATAGYLLYLGYNEFAVMIKELRGFALQNTPVVAVIATIDILIAMVIVYFYSNIFKERREEEMGKAWPIGAGNKESKLNSKIAKAEKKANAANEKLAKLKAEKAKGV